MPTYEYECKEKSCKHAWEEQHSIKRAPTKTCPKCKRDTAQRLICCSGVFRLKGRGWASDGYASHT
jgi:putative FmdB family regulatory protein